MASNTTEKTESASSDRSRKRLPSEDLYIAGIAKRREETKKLFAVNASRLIDSRQLKQSDVMKLLDKYFEEQDIREEKDATKVRTVPAWELSRWTLGKNPPDYDAVLAFASVFGVDTEDLIPGLQAEMNPDAVVTTQRQASNGRWYWEFKGVVGPETHRKLMMALAEMD